MDKYRKAYIVWFGLRKAYMVWIERLIWYG